MKRLLFISSLLIINMVFAQEITMFDDGLTYHFYEDQNRITYKEISERISKDSLAAANWKKARIKNVFANGILLSDLAIKIYANSSEKPFLNHKQARLLSSYLLVSSISSIFLVISRQKSKRKAILIYNNLFDNHESKQAKVKLQFQPTLFSQNEEKRFASGLRFNLKF
jgi:hypothetical protein